MLKIIKLENDWKDVKNVSRTTVNKQHTEKNPSPKFKEDILISEHSPIRLLKVRFMFLKIKSWVATHFSRHVWECFISTGRSDRTGIDRGKLSQDTLVDLDAECNAQHLIDTSRKRLCFTASDETREEWEGLKISLRSKEPELSNVMVPNGIYRGGCPELFSSCNYCEKILLSLDQIDSLDIKKRYNAYNKAFYEKGIKNDN